MEILPADTTIADPTTSDDNEVRVELLGGVHVLRGHSTVALSMGSARLLAFVCLRRQAVRRILVAGTLWPNVNERRAYAALRSALSRLDRAARAALAIGPLTLSLAAGVAVDVCDAEDLARRLLDPVVASADPDFTARAITKLSSDLLPGWYDDWALAEAEDWRQLRLHALEVIVGSLTAAGRFGDAAAAATAAVHADPLRETARGVLIRVHLAEGNRSEALRDFESYRLLLKYELNEEPSANLQGLVARR